MLFWLWFSWPGSDAEISLWGQTGGWRVSLFLTHSLAWWQWQGQETYFIEIKKGSLWLLHYPTPFNKEKTRRQEAFSKDSNEPIWGARGKSQDRKLHDNCLIFSHLSPALSSAPSSECPDIALSLRNAAPNANDPQIKRFGDWSPTNTMV